MAKSSKTDGNKAITAIIIAVAVIIILSAVIMAVNCAGNSRFTVKYNGKNLSNRDKIILPMDGESHFEISGAKGQCIIFITVSKDFEYYAGDKIFYFQNMDLTPFFLLEETRTENSFSLQCTAANNGLKGILTAAHDGAEITGDLPQLAYPYRLTVTSAGGEQITIFFAPLGISLSESVLYF